MSEKLVRRQSFPVNPGRLTPFMEPNESVPARALFFSGEWGALAFDHGTIFREGSLSGSSCFKVAPMPPEAC